MNHKLAKFTLVLSMLCLTLVLQHAKAKLHPNTITHSKYHVQNPLGSLQIENLIIFTMFKDHQGFIWLGTSEGVLRYDGYEFKSTHNDFEQLEVWSIIQDDNKDLWFGTRNKGLVQQSNTDQKITYFQYDSKNPKSLSHNNVRKLLLSKQGKIYVATSGGGLNKFDIIKKTFEHISLENKDNSSTLYLRDIVESSKGELWIATRDIGIIKLNPQTQQLTYFQASLTDEKTLSSNITQALSLDESNQKLWVGTWGGGLNKLDTKTGLVRRIYQERYDKHKAGPQIIVSLMRDKQGTLWLGTLNGVAYFDLAKEQFHYLKDEYSQFSTQGQAAYYALMYDQFGSIWLGSWRGQLHFLALEDHNFHLENLARYFHEDISEISISAVLIAESGDIWLGTETNGVLHLDENMQLIKLFQHQPGNVNSLSDYTITTIKQLTNGDIWVGTMSGGLNKYQESSDDFVSYSLLNEQVGGASNYISTIFEYDNKLLIGTSSGLFDFNLQNDAITKVELIAKEQPYTSNDSISAMFLDSLSRLWLATSEGIYLKEKDMPFKLLLSFNEELSIGHINFSFVENIEEDMQQNIWLTTNTGLWKLEGLDEGINGNSEIEFRKYLSATLSAMQKDNSGQLWLASNNNLYRFSPSNYQYDTFSILDGIKGSFNSGATSLADNNQLYFGSSHGLLTFEPKNIVTEDHQIRVTITDLLLANKSVQADVNSKVLNKPIYQTQQITLPHNENIIAFDTSALDFRQPNKVIYQHRLLGFDEAWIENTAKNRRITYTNLNAGEYTLSIRGAYAFNPGWGESTDLKINILPPLWLTWWAKLIYMLAALLLLRTIYSLHKHRILFSAYEQAALTDSLTGLKNRRFLESTIDQDISQSMRLKKDHTLNADVTFFFADIDFFKDVNDDFGHESGDLVLKQFADLLQEVFRSSDHIIRWGGEEFLVVSRFGQANRAQEMAERLRIKVCNTAFQIANGKAIGKTVSIGFTTIPFDRAASCRLSCSQLIEVADKALYFVKENGRNGWAGISAGDHFDLKNFARIGDFDLLEKVKSGEIQLVHKLSKHS